MRMLHLAIVAVGMLLYAGVHAGLVHHDSLLRDHGPDVIAGAVLLSIFELWPGKPDMVVRLLASFGGKVALVLGASLSWEVIVPLMQAHSVADWRDVLAYLAGGALQHGLVMLAIRRAQSPPSKLATSESALPS